MTLRRAMIVGVRTVHEFVSNRCREDVRTRKRRVHGTGCEAGLGEGVSAVVRRVIVTVVIVLADRYIPPSGLVRARSHSGAPTGEVRSEAGGDADGGAETARPPPAGVRRSPPPHPAAAKARCCQ